MATRRESVDVHYQSAKAHLAGVKAAQVWHQELVTLHLLHEHDTPTDQPTEPGQGQTP